jgi:ATP-dependent DNA helicase RecG
LTQNDNVSRILSRMSLVSQMELNMRYPESESNMLEFKQEMPQNDQIIKTIIGFCNQHGGKLILGVADDRTIRGLSSVEVEQAIESIDRALYDACHPHILPRISAQRFEDKTIVIIEVSEGMNKPYYRRAEGIEKGTYIRLGRHTLRATPDIIQELQWQSSGIDFECLPAYQATIEDLNNAEIKNFLKNRKNHGKTELTEQVMKSYSLITYDQSKQYPTMLGLLLFGRDLQLYISEAMIICTHFRGKSGREAIATVDCVGTLFNQFKQAYAFITERLYRSFTIKKLKRDELLEIPEQAIREALLNAIIHRNYHIKAPTKISIYDDRVEFFSPGQFPGPLRVDNLLAGISYLRNPIICKILREANYIEKLGSGFITIFNSYEERKLNTPQVFDGENYVKCILPRGASIKEHSTISEQDKIMQLFARSNEIDINQVIHALSVSRATAVRRMNELIKKGMIKRMGHAKAIRYQKASS